MPGGNLSCWTGSFTWERCCNVIYGPFGNGVCWDGAHLNPESCCLNDHFHPKGCLQFASHFDFSIVRLVPQLWDRCVEGLELHAELCNSPRASREHCPGCEHLPEELFTYIRCVRQAQPGGAGLAAGSDEHAPEAAPGVAPGVAAEVGAGGAEAVAEAGPEAALGGWHYPTLFVPRRWGRDFSVAVPALDAYVGNRLVADGEWMPHEVRLLAGLVRPGDVVVDAGANIGGFTLPLARRVGQSGRVHAFEPFRLLFQCLNANVMLNGLNNVHTYQLGLGNQTRSFVRRQPNLNTISNPSKMHVAASVASELLIQHDPRPGSRELVRVVRLDDIGFGHRGPSLVKVDVESMELPLLQGAESTLQRFRPLLYVEDSEPDETEDGDRPTQLVRHLLLRGYLVVDLVRSGMLHATSTLFVPQERRAEVMQRLREIRWNG